MSDELGTRKRNIEEIVADINAALGRTCVEVRQVDDECEVKINGTGNKLPIWKAAAFLRGMLHGAEGK